jgi:hypothetical protein
MYHQRILSLRWLALRFVGIGIQACSGMIHSASGFVYHVRHNDHRRAKSAASHAA